MTGIQASWGRVVLSTLAVAALFAACEPATPTPTTSTSSTAASTAQSTAATTTTSTSGTPTSVSGVIWLDLDEDGIREAGEPPISGASVMIGNWVSAPTGADGTYSYPNLEALTGSAVAGAAITFAVNAVSDQNSLYYWQSMYLFSPSGVGPEATDSDVSETGVAYLTTGAQIIDVGVPRQHSSASFSAGSTTGSVSTHGGTRVTGRAWNDLDGDGVREAGEPALSGVQLWDPGWFITDCCGAPSGTTASDGTYDFRPDGGTGTAVEGQFAMGTGYFVRLSAPTPPAGMKWVPTAPDAGGNDTLDSDAYLFASGDVGFVLEYGTQTRDVGFRLVPA